MSRSRTQFQYYPLLNRQKNQCSLSEWREVARWVLFAVLGLMNPSLLLAVGTSQQGVDGELLARSSEKVRVVEGDILVVASAWRRAIALSTNAKLWPYGIVPYRIDSALPASSIDAINTAIAHWNKVSGITLRPVEAWTGETSQPDNSILFQSGDGCASWVGMRGGEQAVWVAPNCATGSVMHEIGHALGLEHEHTRIDRDQYIEIHWDNIESDKHHNFDVAPSGSRLLGDYDYGSIMHYGEKNFSLNGEPTITPLFAAKGSIGQRNEPSSGDIAAIAQLYTTDLSVTTYANTVSDGIELSIYVSNEGLQGAHDIRLSVSADFTALKAYSESGWRCQMTDSQRQECLLEQLSTSASSTLMLLLKPQVEAEKVLVEVSSKSPDNDLSNNRRDLGDDATWVPIVALEDPVPELENEVAGGRLSWCLGSLLLFVLLNRQAGCRINRQTGDRVK